MTNPASALLKKDHDTVKDLFDRFENAEGRPAKKKIVDQASLAYHTMRSEMSRIPARKAKHTKPTREDGARGSVFSPIRAARKHFGVWKQIGIKNATLTR